MGNFHYQGSPAIDDVLLAENLVDRMYDVLADEEKFRQHDQWIGRFAASLDQSRPYTTREFLYLLGLELGKHCKEDGIVSAAAKAGIPLYCPAIADSSIGIGIAANRYEGGNRFTFDVIGDVVETARIVAESEATGVIYFGGGTPKNFVQQTEVTAIIMNTGVTGHKYAIQCVTDSPHWGGLSGCTFEEAQSWGKIAKDASMVTCHSDSTIAMPILVSALLEHTRAGGEAPSAQLHAGEGIGSLRPVMSALKIPMYQVDAFAGHVFSGNPAAVCPLEIVATGRADAGHRGREQSGRDGVLRAQRHRVTNCAGSRRWWKWICAGTPRWPRRQVILNDLTPGERSVSFETKSGTLTVTRDGDLYSMDFPSRPPAALRSLSRPGSRARRASRKRCWRRAIISSSTARKRNSAR